MAASVKPPKPTRPLTRKQMAFIKYLVDNPKASATAAAKAAYNVTTQGSAEVAASRTLRNDRVRLELAKHSGTAELALIEVMDYSRQLGKSGTGAGAAYAGVALTAAKDILDRVHGKATQRIEQQSTSVVLNIDLTGATTGEVDN